MTDTTDALLRFALDAEVVPPAVDSLRAWWDATAARRNAWAEPAARAFAAGVCADRLGFAFVGGYAEALRAMVPTLDGITAMCATEEGGAHPRAIKTSLTPGEPGTYVVSGRKRWATVATAASSLLVVASTGVEDGRNRLRIVRIAANAPGVKIEEKAAVFVPEIPHAEIELDRVVVAEADVLPGDGYTRYLKPFRTIEDIHVHAALAGYLVGVVRRLQLPQGLTERLLGLAVATRALAATDPTSPAAHVALAGVFELFAPVVGDVERAWTERGGDELVRWQRDRVLMQVAGKARAARRERAWTTLAGGEPAPE